MSRYDDTFGINDPLGDIAGALVQGAAFLQRHYPSDAEPPKQYTSLAIDPQGGELETHVSAATRAAVETLEGVRGMNDIPPALKAAAQGMLAALYECEPGLSESSRHNVPQPSDDRFIEVLDALGDYRNTPEEDPEGFKRNLIDYLHARMHPEELPPEKKDPLKADFGIENPLKIYPQLKIRD